MAENKSHAKKAGFVSAVLEGVVYNGREVMAAEHERRSGHIASADTVQRDEC